MGNCCSSEEKNPSQQQSSSGQLQFEGLNLDLRGVDLSNNNNNDNNNTATTVAEPSSSGPIDLRAPAKCSDAAFLQFVNSTPNANKVTHLIFGGEYSSDECIITGASIQVIADRFPALVDLDLMHATALAPDDMALLAKIPGLKSLYLTYGPAISDAHLAQVAASLPQLTDLDISRCQNFSDAGLASLATGGLKNLTRLSLERNKQIGAAGLAHVGRITSLTQLSLGDMSEKIDDAALANISTLTRLVKLDLDENSAATAAGFQSLAKLTALEELSLSYCEGVTDENLEQFGQNLAASLKVLDIRKCQKVTDAGIAHIGGMTKLVKLFINKIPALTDASLEAVMQLSALERINVEDCPNISQDVIGKFKAAHSKCVVLADRPKK